MPLTLSGSGGITYPDGTVNTTRAASTAGDTFTGQVVLKNSALDLQSGQIKFPATQNASSNANTLDDYEEGTWTPTLLNGGTITVDTYAGIAYYTKIGRQVTITFGNCTISGTANNSNFIVISGLPFAPLGQCTGGFGYINNPSTIYNGFFIDGSYLLMGARRGDYIIRNQDLYGVSLFFSATVTYFV